MEKERFTLVGLGTNEALAKIAVVINRLLRKAPRKVGVAVPSVPYCFYTQNTQPGQVVCSLLAPTDCKVRNLIFHVSDEYFKSAEVLIAIVSKGYEQTHMHTVNTKDDEIEIPITLNKGDIINVKLVSAQSSIRDHEIVSLKDTWFSFMLDIVRPVSDVTRLAVEAIDEGV